MATQARLQNATRSAAADAALNLIDAGAGAGKVEIRSGTGPADPDDAATGTLLVTITLNDPAFGAASNGVKTIDNTPAPSGVAVAAGVAGWARFMDSDNVPRADCDVSEGAGGLIELDNTDIAVDQTVTITGGTITMPA